MGKKQPRNQRPETVTSFGDDLPPKPSAKRAPPLQPKNAAQKSYVNSINVNTITWGIGPAGTGKTYIAARKAAAALDNGEIKKIILTRPAVTAEEDLGFLPGDLEEKMAPFIASYSRGFEDELGGGAFKYHLAYGNIEIVPFAFMQGLSWDKPCYVLFDEAENATRRQMKMFLTRLGEGAKAIISGDPKQCMLAQHSQSGLIDGVQKTRYIRSVDVVEFERSDIVRSGIVRAILDAYDAEGEEDERQGELPGFITQRAA